MMLLVVLGLFVAGSAAMPTGSVMEALTMRSMVGGYPLTGSSNGYPISSLRGEYAVHGLAPGFPMTGASPGWPLNSVRASTSEKTCEVYFYRVFVPNKMVYAWNCICFEGDPKIQYVRGGARYAAVDDTETTLDQVLFSVHCFNHAYHKMNLHDLCMNDPGSFLDKTTPVLKYCTDTAQQKYPGSGPPSYDRSHCSADFSQARQEGLTMVASVWICQCAQPDWKPKDGTMPYIIDGRMPFAVQLSDSRPDVIDYMEKCTTPYKAYLNNICQSAAADFGVAVQRINIHCCMKANAELKLSLDCEKIATTS